MGDTETHHFYDSGTLGRVPEPILFIFGDTKTLQIVQEKTKSFLKKLCLGKFEI